MSKDFNQCSFTGRLGKDPEIRYSNSGKAIANFSIACGDDYFDKNKNDWIERTNWIRVVAFDKLAERVGEKLTKGEKILVSGKLTERKWQDNSGNDRYTTEIVANDMQMLGGRNGQAGQNGAGQANQRSSTSRTAQTKDTVATNNKHQEPELPDFDDDIPF